MKKLSTNKTDKLILGYVIKVILTSIITILIFSYIFSQIIYKLDLSLDTSKVFSIIIFALCSFIISFVSVSGMKNNGLLMGIISEIPIIFYSLINVIFNNHNFLFFIIKIAVAILIGALVGIIRTTKSKKFKVK